MFVAPEAVSGGGSRWRASRRLAPVGRTSCGAPVAAAGSWWRAATLRRWPAFRARRRALHVPPPPPAGGDWYVDSPERHRSATHSRPPGIRFRVTALAFRPRAEQHDGGRAQRRLRAAAGPPVLVLSGGAAAGRAVLTWPGDVRWRSAAERARTYRRWSRRWRLDARREGEGKGKGRLPEALEWQRNFRRDGAGPVRVHRAIWSDAPTGTSRRRDTLRFDASAGDCVCAPACTATAGRGADGMWPSRHT